MDSIVDVKNLNLEIDYLLCFPKQLVKMMMEHLPLYPIESMLNYNHTHQHPYLIGHKIDVDIQRAGGRRWAAIARRLHQPDPQRQVDVANQIGQQNHAAGEHAQHG